MKLIISPLHILKEVTSLPHSSIYGQGQGVGYGCGIFFGGCRNPPGRRWAACINPCPRVTCALDLTTVTLPDYRAGAALYLLYGIHSSTAASEFPLPQAPVGGSPRQPSPKISLQPLALQPHSIVSHIVPSHRSHPSSQRRLAELDTVFIQH